MALDVNCRNSYGNEWLQVAVAIFCLSQGFCV